jgi:WS/DGAT/MGAT family acyltransferase
MAEITYDEWMSESDALLWHIERDPVLRSTVTSVWLFASPLDRARVDEVLERMLATLPRLSQRVVDDLPGVGTPRWEPDPTMDLGLHYRWIRLTGARPTFDDVLAHAANEAARAFDKNRPLWELTVVDKLAGKRSAVIFKVHHAIADGLGMVKMLEQMVDLGPEPTEPTERPPVEAVAARSASATPAAGRAIGHRLATDTRTGIRATKASLRAAASLARDPVGAVRDARTNAASVARVVKPAATPLSPVMTGRSMSLRFRTATASVDAMRAAAHTVDGRLNDAFIASLLSGLDRYHRAMGTPAHEVRLHMPVSVRGGGSESLAGNQFVPTRMVLPLGAIDPADRLREVHALLRDVRAEPALPHVNDISGAISRLGLGASVNVLGAMMKGCDITASNVPGPPFPVWVAGARVERFFAYGPPAGSALNVTVFSYDGTLHYGINIDPAAVTDPDLLVRCIAEGIDEVTTLAG